MSSDNTIVYVQLENCGKKFGDQLASIIHVDECHFTEINSAKLLFQICAGQNKFLSRHSIVSFTNSIFYNIQSCGILSGLKMSGDKPFLWKP